MSAKIQEYLKSTIAGLNKAMCDLERERRWYGDTLYTMNRCQSYNPSIEEIQKECSSDLGEDRVRFQEGECTSMGYLDKTIKKIDEEIRFLRIKRRWHMDKLDIFVNPYADKRYYETEDKNPDVVRLCHLTVQSVQDSWKMYKENLKVSPWPPQWDKYL